MQCTAWAGQCALYILIMMFEKVLIILVLLIPQWKKVSKGASVELYYPCGKCMNSNSTVNFVVLTQLC